MVDIKPRLSPQHAQEERLNMAHQNYLEHDRSVASATAPAAGAAATERHSRLWLLVPAVVAMLSAGCATKALHPATGISDPKASSAGAGRDSAQAGQPGKAASGAARTDGGAAGTGRSAAAGAGGGAGGDNASTSATAKASGDEGAGNRDGTAAGKAGTGAGGDTASSAAGVNAGAGGANASGVGGANAGAAGANAGGAAGADRSSSGAGAGGRSASGGAGAAGGSNDTSGAAGSQGAAGANAGGGQGSDVSAGGQNGSNAGGAGSDSAAGAGGNNAGRVSGETGGAAGGNAGGASADSGGAGGGNAGGVSGAGDNLGAGVGVGAGEGDADNRIAAIEVPNKNVKVDEEFKPQTLGGMLPLVLGVNEEGRFDFNQYALRDEVKAVLDDLADKLKSAEFDRLDVFGYTDRIGTREYNKRLSELRAWSVAQYLIQKGVPENKVFYEGRGDKDPLTRTDECTGLARTELITCLQKDRRVEIEASIRRKHATVTQ
jgi:outer membrane protein OmpA-like peptidoglycan-associated protein